MDTGDIIAVIALVLASFSSIVATIQVQHFIRFRRPVYSVREATLDVGRSQIAGLDGPFVGPGSIVVDIRGASRPITFTKLDVTIFEGDRPVGSLGGQDGEPRLLEAELWMSVTIPVPMGVRLEAKDPPQFIDAEAYLSNPRDELPIRVRLMLNKDGDKYTYRGDFPRLLKHISRYRWRHRVRRLFNSLRRRSPGAGDSAG